MNLAKSLIGRKKTIVIIAHLCSEMAVFDRNSIRSFQRIDPILKNKECHSILINRIPVMAPILVPILGVHFFRGIFPSKMGRFAPFLATIQRLSKTCGFLPNKRSESCFVWAAPSLLLARTYFIIALNMWFVSWESTLARVKASKRGANVTRAEIIKYANSKYLPSYKNC
jgi:hypothetical protein